MKIYYHSEVGGLRYEYGKFWFEIETYYLLKEGWIRCVDYRKDVKDAYYIVDSDGNPGTRKDYCIPYKDIKANEMFIKIKDARENAKKMMVKIYKEERLILHKAYKDILKTICNYKTNRRQK